MSSSVKPPLCALIKRNSGAGNFGHKQKLQKGNRAINKSDKKEIYDRALLEVSFGLDFIVKLTSRAVGRP